MNLPDTIKAIQRAVGETPDGKFGPLTAALVWRALNDAPDNEAQPLPDGAGVDGRSGKALATLDSKAQDRFIQFYNLANATAATLGCTYVIIGGNRTWEEQDALYERGRTTAGKRVTQAMGGQSNHNFGIAADFGVFQGSTYLDEAKPELAAKVHKACSLHAPACGLEWGGSWKSIVDQPHYEIATGLTMMRKRELYQEKGSVL